MAHTSRRRTSMSRKRHKPEEIVAKLRQVDVLVAQGTPVADAIRAIGVTEVTYSRWRQEYGGLKSDQVKRMKELETENQRLRKAAHAAALPIARTRDEQDPDRDAVIHNPIDDDGHADPGGHRSANGRDA